MNRLEPIPTDKLITLLQLQRQIRDAEQDKQLQQLQQDIIRQYCMVEGDYTVIVTLHEASQLMPRTDNIGLVELQKQHCNGFVEIDCFGQTRKSKVRKQTNNPIFDERFYFSFKNVTQEELEAATIKFSIFDRSALIIKKALVGVVELDWTNIYFRRNHEIYRGWLTLCETEETQSIDQPLGYLLVNVAVLGPQDKQTVHDSKFIKDPLTTIEETITIKKSRLVDYTIKVEVFRAEHLPPIDSIDNEVKAYVVAKFSGGKIRSSKIRSSNPQWNELLKLGTKVPTRSKFLYLEVWASQMVYDDLIGVVRVPFSEITQGKFAQPRWFNLYGPPISGKDRQPLNYCTKMQLYGDTLGSHYRGRLLFNIEGLTDVYSKSLREPITFKFPYRPIPNVPQKAYVFRSYIFEGFEIPGKDDSEICVHIVMGPYLLYSSKAKLTKGRCGWYQKLQDKRVVLPCGSDSNLEQLPDIIVYLSTGDYEKNRMSFIRIKATSILTTNDSPEVNTYELNEDKSLDLLQNHECGGYLTMKVQLFNSSPPPPLNPRQYESRTEPYDLRIYLYMAQELPPANDMGDSDPYMLFRCAGESITSEVKSNTLNPCWYQICRLKVTFQNIFKSLSSKGIMCILYDKQPKQKTDNFIGRVWVPIQFKHRMKFSSTGYRDIDMLHQRPKWYHIRNQSASLGQQMLGRVLLAWSLIPWDHAERVPLPKSPIDYMRPTFERVKVQLFVIGIRSLNYDGNKLENLKAVLSFSQPKFSQGAATEICKVKNAGCSFNALLEIEVELPQNPNLSAFMEVKLISEKHNGETKFLGFASVQLHTLLERHKKKAITSQQPSQAGVRLPTVDEESEDTVVDVDRLEKDLQLLQKKKADEQRIKDQPGFGVEETTLRKVTVPTEFGSTKHNSEVDSKLDKLFSQFEEDFNKVDGQYDYVRQLEKEKDTQQRLRNPAVMHLDVESEMQSNNEDASLLSGGFNELEREHHFTHLPLDPHIDRNSELSGPSQNRRRMEPFEPDRTIDSKDRRQTRDKLLKKQKEQMQSAEAVHLDELELTKRYTFKLDAIRIQPNDQISEEGESAIKGVKYNDIQQEYQMQQQHQKLALQKQSTYKYSSAVKLTLFKWRQRSKKRRDQQTYQDFDTDPEENLDITPEWYKGRKILAGDYEDRHKPTTKLKQMDIFCGETKRQGEDFRSRRKIASLKMIVLSEMQPQATIEKYKHYSQILTPKFYICRIYFLKGKSLISEYRERPTTYLRITYGSEQTSLKETTTCQESTNPEYYCHHDIVMELPGPSTVRVEVMEDHKLRSDKVLGYTDIDLQSRYLTRHWHLLQRKPIELRNLYSDYGRGSQGRLEMWIDLIERKNWESMPAEKIHAPPYDQYELRVIVWGTKGCVFKDVAEGCNDLFVRGYIGSNDPQQTDVHWRCRGQGSFNWRWKFNVHYPPKPEQMYSDILTVQIWDKDVVGYNDLIGQCRINLNRIHRLVEKTVKRKKPTKAYMKIVEKGMDTTDRFYFDVYNEKELDEFGNKVSQGKVQLSFELVPAEQAKEKLKNGYGRSEPNLHPSLPSPTGRMKFDCMHPKRYLRQILGSKLYKKLKRKAWCIVVIIIVGLLLYIIIGQLLARLITPCKTA